MKKQLKIKVFISSAKIISVIAGLFNFVLFNGNFLV